MHQRNKELSTQQKALEINLDERIYGALVEIGAGQEVARQFFSAGAAAGTVAKTMSAYDMQVSDDIYGKAGAYVSRERLEQMLSREFELLTSRLSDSKSKNTSFFSYAATVTAKSFKQKNECHGWIGTQLQLYPDAPPSEIILHVRMLDNDNYRQAEALGILGVNLIHSANYYKENPKMIIESLLDNLDGKRMEVDLINFRGPYFDEVDNRLMNLHLVRSWCCRAVMFGRDGASLVPGAALRKKDVMVMRGTFKPPHRVHADMCEAALEQFQNVKGLGDRGILTVAEITMSELASSGKVDDADFLARVDLLVALGYNVLLSDYLRYFKLRSWIRRYTSNTIGLILSVRDFNTLFDKKYYEGLEGGILEAMGKLFSDNTHVYVYPAKIDGELVTLDNVQVDPKLKSLLDYLIATQSLIPIENYKEENLHISTKLLLEKLGSRDESWQDSVPEKIIEQIVDKKLFGFDK